MGRLTQMLDYINREPNKFSKEFVITNYTKLSVNDHQKEIRKKYRKQLNIEENQYNQITIK